jgi:hypothetical protein
VQCDRRRLEGIVIDLNINKIDVPCYARESDTYQLENEYIHPDKETDFGYLEDNLLNEKHNIDIKKVWTIIN